MARRPSLGQQIKKYRLDRGMTATDLARRARVSKSYISELENGSGQGQGPSATVLYRIANALGIAMSDLLGRPIIPEPPKEPPPSLLAFAKKEKLPETDVRMLAGIEFRGEPPRTPERWQFIYQAIKTSRSLDG